MAKSKKTAAREAAKVLGRISMFVYHLVRSIYGDVSPVARVGEARIFNCIGFKICIIGFDVYIQVDDPTRTDAAIRYAENIVKTRCKHHFDDEAYMRKLEDKDGNDKMRYLYGGVYVDEINEDKEKQYLTDVEGVFVENTFRPFEGMDDIA